MTSKNTLRVQSTLRYDEDTDASVAKRSVIDPTWQAQNAASRELEAKLARFAEVCDDEFLKHATEYWDARLAETEAAYANSPADPCYSIREVGEQIADELISTGHIDEGDRFLAAAWLYDERGVVDYVVFRALEELGWTIQINQNNELLSVWADRLRKAQR